MVSSGTKLTPGGRAPTTEIEATGLALAFRVWARGLPTLALMVALPTNTGAERALTAPAGRPPLAVVTIEAAATKAAAMTSFWIAFAGYVTVPPFASTSARISVSQALMGRWVSDPRPQPEDRDVALVLYPPLAPRLQWSF